MTQVTTFECMNILDSCTHEAEYELIGAENGGKKFACRVCVEYLEKFSPQRMDDRRKSFVLQEVQDDNKKLMAAMQPLATG